MRKFCFFIAALMVMASAFLPAQTQLFDQPYNAAGYGYTSTWDPSCPADYEVADNFSGLSSPLNRIVFYGLTAYYVGGDWIPTPPGAVEPFFVRFYEFEQGWSEPDPGVLATTAGTYIIVLYDTYGDGWHGGLLDVYVDGVQVLAGLTIINGAGPLEFTFPANAGQYIQTVYTAGNWYNENWYQILNPLLNIIASDGPADYGPSGIGDPPTPPLLAPVSGAYTVNLYDTYGDGWNGGMLDVFLNNIQVLNDITVASGAGPAYYTFTAEAGDVIATVYTPGDWPQENWYETLIPP